MIYCYCSPYKRIRRRGPPPPASFAYSPARRSSIPPALCVRFSPTFDGRARDPRDNRVIDTRLHSQSGRKTDRNRSPVRRRAYPHCIVILPTRIRARVFVKCVHIYVCRRRRDIVFLHRSARLGPFLYIYIYIYKIRCRHSRMYMYT
jgi:hypothetical protein